MKVWRKYFFIILGLAGITGLSLPSFAEEQAEASTRKAFQLVLDEDYAAAREIVQPLAAAGEADAQHILALLYEKGFGVEQDMARALDLYARSALQGQADSQFALGELAYSGAGGVAKDHERAAGWYKLAAAGGHKGAQARLGVLYAEGEAVKRDMSKAAAMFEDAAASGDAEAQYHLGALFFTGEGVEQDLGLARDWFRRSAEQGHALAQYNLAVLLDADGSTSGEMVQWMRAAAQAGLPDAQVAMGLLTHDGRAGAKGESPADWFEKAANAGDPQGQFLYAVALSEGDGRRKNVKAARALLEELLADKANLRPELRRNAEALQEQLSKKGIGSFFRQ
ncbi:MAG: hypothetical protein DHS20C05_10680 [Hyphococcus sp.]|nr:MAG: hypothetical protein DHS20C05_10680 [Marinicaulis sp.]